jgi:hypothetical protein
MNSVFIFNYLFYCHLNFNSYFWRYGLLVSTLKYEFSIYIQPFLLFSFKILVYIFGGTDHRSHPRNMNSVFIFNHFFYCHLNFNSYFWRYRPSVSSPKYESCFIYIIYNTSFYLVILAISLVTKNEFGHKTIYK